jgi:hypothetical protein
VGEAAEDLVMDDYPGVSVNVTRNDLATVRARLRHAYDVGLGLIAIVIIAVIVASSAIRIMQVGIVQYFEEAMEAASKHMSHTNGCMEVWAPDGYHYLVDDPNSNAECCPYCL